MRNDLVAHVCHCCGGEWSVSMYNELGGWFYFEDEDAFCPECDSEGEIDESA